MRSSIIALSLLALLGGCDESHKLQQSSGSTTPAIDRAKSEPSPVEKLTQPVKIGELGRQFPACNARGTTRRILAGGDTLSVHTSPFSGAEVVAELPAGAGFFVCTRSLDQQWFGIVFEEGGAAAASCGVLAPVPTRRDYAGPCRSGWVSSAFVKLTAD